jgi:hypothetical protein
MNPYCLIRYALGSALVVAGALTSNAQTLSVSNGLQLWLRADAGITTNATGGVIQWNDQSTNANHAAQGTDAQAPALVNGALNSRPVLRFDGMDDFLDVADSDSLSGAGDMASFFVVKFDDFATFRAVWSKTTTNLPAPTDLYALPGSGVLRVLRGDGTANNLGAVDSAQALRDNTYLVLGFDVTGETLNHYLNNQPNGSGTVTTNTADANTSLKIGTRNDFVTRLKGDLAELLIYNRALSLTERSNVFNYLQTKYNLLNLPPSITLTATPPGPAVNVGDVVTLNAAAADLDGTIVRVDFFANGAPVGTATQPPYSVRVRIDSAGSVQFTARATDNRDATANSAALTFTATQNGPTDLPVTAGLQLWLKADASITVGGGGGVVQWGDQSGNANNAQQLDENLAPVLTNNAVNGRPALRFDGTDDFLEIADSVSLSIVGDITSFFVLRFADFATFRGIWAKTSANLPAPTDMYALPSNGRLRLYRGNGTGTGIQFVDSASPFTAGNFLLAGFDQAGTAVTHYLNGLANGTGSITVPLADTDGTLRIGTRADLVTKLKGELAELLIFDRALSPAERRAVERYLAEKYGLPMLIAPTNMPPQIAITSPVGGQVLQAPGMVTINASASDSDGSIASVQFLADGAPLSKDTAAPYTANLNLPYGGVVTLSATTMDNLGAQNNSAAVQVCVQGPGAPAGLVGYWPLDGNANAIIGTGGIMVSNPVPAADRNGMAGGALSFDGALQQRVQIPGGGGLNAARQGTISMWVKWTGAQDTGFGSAAGAVLSRQQDGQFSDNIINLNNADPDLAAVQWRQNSAGTVNITGGALVLNDTWRHIAVTFTETNSELFVDAFSEGTGAGGALDDNPATALAIGAWTGGGDSYATATIDDVAVWNRVLASDEIQLLSSKTRTPLNLLVSPDCPSIERSGANIIVRWGSTAVLQCATDVAGPYADVPGATSPHSVPVADAPRFYRLRSP